MMQVKELEQWGYMPPFHGTESELKALIEYLMELDRGSDYQPPPPEYAHLPVAQILADRAEALAAELAILGREVRR
jgi:mono/diheme cytochrome c family protein